MFWRNLDTRSTVSFSPFIPSGAWTNSVGGTHVSSSEKGRIKRSSLTRMKNSMSQWFPWKNSAVCLYCELTRSCHWHKLQSMKLRLGKPVHVVLKTLATTANLGLDLVRHRRAKSPLAATTRHHNLETITGTRTWLTTTIRILICDSVAANSRTVIYRTKGHQCSHSTDLFHNCRSSHSRLAPDLSMALTTVDKCLWQCLRWVTKIQVVYMGWCLQAPEGHVIRWWARICTVISVAHSLEDSADPCHQYRLSEGDNDQCRASHLQRQLIHLLVQVWTPILLMTSCSPRCVTTWALRIWWPSPKSKRPLLHSHLLLT